MTLLSRWLFFPLVILCFLADLCALTWFGASILQVLLCLYVVQIVRWNSDARLLVVGGALMVESLVLYDAFFLPLVYMVPALVAGWYIRGWLQQGSVQRWLLLAFCITLQFWVVEWWLLGLACPLRYYLYRLCVNMIVLRFI